MATLRHDKYVFLIDLCNGIIIELAPNILMMILNEYEVVSLVCVSIVYAYRMQMIRVLLRI